LHDSARRARGGQTGCGRIERKRRLASHLASPPGLQPSPTESQLMIDWAREHVSALETRNPGVAGHHAREDLPGEIGQAIVSWLAEHRLWPWPRRNARDHASRAQRKPVSFE
jgi:hypothetical protein